MGYLLSCGGRTWGLNRCVSSVELETQCWCARSCYCGLTAVSTCVRTIATLRQVPTPAPRRPVSPTDWLSRHTRTSVAASESYKCKAPSFAAHWSAWVLFMAQSSHPLPHTPHSMPVLLQKTREDQGRLGWSVVLIQGRWGQEQQQWWWRYQCCWQGCWSSRLWCLGVLLRIRGRGGQRRGRGW
jgi:hypothetical protein